MILRTPTRLLSTKGLQTSASVISRASGSSAMLGQQTFDLFATLPTNRNHAGRTTNQKTPTKAAPCNSYFQALHANKSSSSCDPYYNHLKSVMSMDSARPKLMRMFSTTAAPATTPSHRALNGFNDHDNEEATFYKNLNTSILERIKKEFKTIDDNQDGLMQPEEFRQLLRIHSSKFTESEIELVTECFYSGTGGSGVSFDRFLEALDTAAAATASDNKSGDDESVVAKKLGIGSCGAEYILGSKRHTYTPEELDIDLTHKTPIGFTNNFSLKAVKAVRTLFDLGTGWNGDITQRKIMNRVIYLETIAAVPGMVAGILRHFKSLRAMERDGGMVNMFLEEALNERMHLLTFVKMKNPGIGMRLAVLGGQRFGTFYGLAYIISPKFCHSFVGYVEEEACSTYTKIIQAIEEAPEDTKLAAWRTELAPEIGKSYWHLGEDGTVLDLMYAIRADEAEHRDVNHFASAMKKGDLAPVCNPKKQVDLALKKYMQDLMSV